MKIGAVNKFIRTLNEGITDKDLESTSSLEQHIDRERKEVDTNLEKTKSNAPSIVASVASNRNTKNSRGKTPAQQIQTNIEDLEEQSKTVYDLSFDYTVLNAFSRLGINTERAQRVAAKSDTETAINKLEGEIVRLIGANKSYWKTIKTYLESGDGECTLEDLRKAGTMGELIRKHAPSLANCWYDILNTRGGSTGRGEILLAMLLKGGHIEHLGSGDVAFADGNIEIKCGASYLPYDLSCKNKTEVHKKIEEYISVYGNDEVFLESERKIKGGRDEYCTQVAPVFVLLGKENNDYRIYIVDSATTNEQVQEMMFVDIPNPTSTYKQECAIFPKNEYKTHSSWVNKTSKNDLTK